MNEEIALKIGASTKAFGGKSIREVAELFGKSGINTAELCFCQSDLPGFRYNHCGSAELPKAEDIHSLAKVFKSYGVDICAVGAYLNFWSGTDSEIYDTLGLFTEYCDVAYSLGAKTVTTHTGSVFAVPASRGFDQRLRERMYYGFTYAGIEAHKRGLTIGVELCETDAIKTYDEFSRLKGHILDTVGADTLKCICSPCVQSGEIPASEIALFHIKDRKKDGRFYERFGEGSVDFDEFFKEFGNSIDIPMILEYVNSENLASTVKRFRDALNAAKNKNN